MVSQKFSSLSTPLRPRQFPSSVFEVIGLSQRVEEERLPFYKREDYYPMRIGEVIANRYQIVAKLGYGTDSFKLKGPNGEHDVFVMTPLGMGLRTLQEMQKDDIFQQSLVIGALGQVLLGLNFFHEADVVHTGQWHGPAPLPPEKKLEFLASTLSGEDKDMFLSFLECVLTWIPEDRLTSLEAYFHPWLRGERGYSV
ncbi:hypothetical protein F53441_12703 [Fusarium austroafricanum]|uniref:non-specific serine/threonine protein kinase n=1 Tax=Fusarium austroafricanum TaxID=2364996 RepID=A0A8H4JWB2_9HYPO|nr:hypothetical protein F53441_12703 [Fusarium austroafricanum]